jgi:ABC-type sugar transport system permease subunit
MKIVDWWSKNQKKIAPYICISPFYILFLIFSIVPVFFAFYLSFSSWSGVGQAKFVGLSNYTSLFKDQTFALSIRNTIWYIIASILLVLPLALLLAIILNTKILKFKGFFRSMYFMPILTSTVAIAIVFRLLYDRDYGLLNAPLIAWGKEPLDWLGSIELSKLAVIGLVTWRWTGYHMVFFLAGLQSIPPELYESALVDGANKAQSFWYITLPMLRPVITFELVTTLIGASQIFEEPYILTSGGPADSSLSIAEYLYRVGFEWLRFGYASSIGVILFVFIFTFSLLQVKYLGAFRGGE